MKKTTLFLVIILLFIVLTVPSFAQEDPTSIPTKKVTATSIPTKEKSKIDEIKEKIASTVAELNLVSKKSLVGKISKIEKEQLTIERDEQPSIIDVDELTVYRTIAANGKETEKSFSDFNIGDSLVAIGLHNKESRRLLARIVIVKKIPLAVRGIVVEVDIKGGTITIEDKRKNQNFVIDIEASTKTNNYTPATGITKSGLSKIEIGQRAHVYGLPNTDEENRIIALRILLLPDKIAEVTKSPKPVATESASKPSATPPLGQRPSGPAATAKPKAASTPTE